MVTPSAATNSIPASSSSTRLRLHYLDGLRGLAALYVVIFHVYLEASYRWTGFVLPRKLWLASQWMIYGHSAVVVFIVLSGYCLMLPVIRSADAQLSDGLKGFFVRRTRRILPPYYAAVLLSLLLIALTSKWRQAVGTSWADMTPAFTPGVLVSHLLLFHNLNQNWTLKIDSPLWSVAMEWQIYFVFALLLLPIWKRWGISATLVVAFIFGLAPHFLLPAKYNLDPTCPWYIGMFAFGMWGAVIGFSPLAVHRHIHNRVSWGILSFLSFLCNLVSERMHIAWLKLSAWQGDVLVGASAICLIICCTKHLIDNPGSNRLLVLRLLESRWAVVLGTFSYSLYLIHDPLLALLHLPLHMLNLSLSARFLILLIVGVPVCVLAAYGFHCCFERPFLRRPVKKAIEAEQHGLPLKESSTGAVS